MDAAPRGLAPGGPGATGVPLLDCILADPGLAGAVFAHLAPRDVVGLRASCAGARAAVAGHGWESVAGACAWEWRESWPPLGDGIQEAAAELAQSIQGTELTEAGAAVSQSWQRRHDLWVLADRAAALTRWRACFPHARSVVVRVRGEGPRGAGADAVTDGAVGALAAGGTLTRLALVDCAVLTDGALAPFARLTSLSLVGTRSLTGACWGGGLAGRLRSVVTDGTGPVTDAHLPALASCTHVNLGAGAAVSDAGVAAHLARAVTHLALNLSGCRSFNGSCLRSCTRLVGLRLVGYFAMDDDDDDEVKELVPDALAGCAATLASLELDGVDGCDALFAAGGGGLPALRHALLDHLPWLTDAAFAGGATPALDDLVVRDCELFVGGAGLGPLPALTALHVGLCAAFTGRALTGGRTPALRWLSMQACRRFAAGGGGGGGGARFLAPPPAAAAVAPALPALVGARIAGSPRLTDAWFAHTPALAHLVLTSCSGVVGGATVAAAPCLPALTHLAVECCAAFTGGWLGAGGGGGVSTRLESLSVAGCPALALPDALAPGRHPHLRRARFGGGAGDGSPPLPLLSDELLGRSAPALRQLTVQWCAGFVGGPGLGGLLPALEELTVEGCADFSGAGLGGLAALRRLVLIECPAVGPGALASAAAACPALATVGVGGKVRRHSGGGAAAASGGTPLPAPLPPPSALGPGWDARAPAWGWTPEEAATGDWVATRGAPAAGGRDAGAGE
jgi:hypothetical protein